MFVSASKFKPPVWLTPEGDKVSCIEKLKVLNENLEEIRALAEEALADAVLMGCDEKQLRQVVSDIAQTIENPYKKENK